MRTGTSPMKAFIGRPPSDEGDAAAGDFSSLADDWVGLTIHRTVHSEMNGPLTVLFCRKSVRKGGFIGRCTASRMKKRPRNILYLKINNES